MTNLLQMQVIAQHKELKKIKQLLQIPDANTNDLQNQELTLAQVHNNHNTISKVVKNYK